MRRSGGHLVFLLAERGLLIAEEHRDLGERFFRAAIQVPFNGHGLLGEYAAPASRVERVSVGEVVHLKPPLRAGDVPVEAGRQDCESARSAENLATHAHRDGHALDDAKFAGVNPDVVGRGDPFARGFSVVADFGRGVARLGVVRPRIFELVHRGRPIRARASERDVAVARRGGTAIVRGRGGGGAVTAVGGFAFGWGLFARTRDHGAVFGDHCLARPAFARLGQVVSVQDRASLRVSPDLFGRETGREREGDRNQGEADREPLRAFAVHGDSPWAPHGA